MALGGRVPLDTQPIGLGDLMKGDVSGFPFNGGCELYLFTNHGLAGANSMRMVVASSWAFVTTQHNNTRPQIRISSPCPFGSSNLQQRCGSGFVVFVFELLQDGSGAAGLLGSAVLVLLLMLAAILLFLLVSGLLLVFVARVLLVLV